MMEDLAALERAAAIGEREDRGFLEITGKDRVRFLHNLTTNDVLLLAAGRQGQTFGKGDRTDFSSSPEGPGQFSCCVTRQGRMTAMFHVWMLRDRLWLDADRAALPSLRAALESRIIMEECAIADRSDDFAYLRLEGPAAPGILRDAFGWKDGTPPFSFQVCGGARISPFPLSEQPGFHLIVPAAESSPLLAALEKAGARRIGAEPMERHRIRWGFPRWGRDADDTMLPMEAGLEPIAVSYSKGCYLGQEVIQRVKTYSEPPRRLVHLVSPGDRPFSSGTDIPAVGTVTSSAALPGTGRVYSLARVRKETAALPEIEIEGVKARVEALPWQRHFPRIDS